MYIYFILNTSAYRWQFIPSGEYDDEWMETTGKTLKIDNSSRSVVEKSEK